MIGGLGASRLTIAMRENGAVSEITPGQLLRTMRKGGPVGPLEPAFVCDAVVRARAHCALAGRLYEEGLLVKWWSVVSGQGPRVGR